MNAGVVQGRHYQTGEPVRVRCRAGRIEAVEPASDLGEEAWVAPGLVDLQVNGFGGVDFQRDDLTAAELEVAVAHLRQAGCTRFLPTLITEAWPRLTRRLRQLRRCRAESPALRAAMAGWHLEGPFLSAEPGFCGAHDAAAMIDPSPAHLRELREIVAEDAVLLTLAPERPGALEAIAQAVALGFRVSLGHTNAPAAILAEAVRRGATGFTHLGNACPPQLDRHDNILWRVLDTPGLTVGLISDQLHVPPLLFRVIHRVLGPERIYYTTDAMAAAGAPAGRYTLGTWEVEVGADRVVQLPGRTHFAGSALRPVEGVFGAARMLRQTWRQTWDGLAVRPARWMGWLAGLEVGAPADLCRLQLSAGGELERLSVWAGGEQVV
jgi:N-acetylglucosamine-6-phosphate deacetylase